MRTASPYLVRARPDRAGDWLVWIRPVTGLDPATCALWTRKSLRSAPPEFLRRFEFPRSRTAANRVVLALIDYLKTSAPAPAAPKGPTVKDYVKRFTDAETSPRAKTLKARGEPYSIGTLDNYLHLYDSHIATDAALCALRMDAVGPDDLEAYFGRLLDSLGGACRTHQAAWAFLHMVFRQYSRDTRTPSPFASLDKPTYDEEVRGALTPGELLTIFGQPFPSALDRAICALAFWAGLRRAEVFALRWADVDEAGKVITVRHSFQRFGDGLKKRLESGTKSRRSRQIPAIDYVLDALKALTRVDEYVISFPDGQRPGGIRKRGKRPGEYDWRNAMGGALARAGVDTAARKITPHSSRHSIASVLLSLGVPKDYIRRILGHFDERTTDRYLHMAREELDKLTAALNGGIK